MKIPRADPVKSCGGSRADAVRHEEERQQPLRASDGAEGQVPVRLCGGVEAEELGWLLSAPLWTPSLSHSRHSEAIIEAG